MKYAECLSVYRHFCCSEFKWKSGWEKKDSSLMHVLKEKIGSSCTKVEILSFSEKAEHSTPSLGGTLFCTLALFILCLVQRGQTISQEEKNCCTYLCVCHILLTSCFSVGILPSYCSMGFDELGGHPVSLSSIHCAPRVFVLCHHKEALVVWCLSGICQQEPGRSVWPAGPEASCCCGDKLGAEASLKQFFLVFMRGTEQLREEPNCLSH